MEPSSTVVFDSIESAQEFVGLLCEAVTEGAAGIESQIAAPSPETSRRHLDALRLVEFKLDALRQHLVASRRLLTDLRTLRRYLLDERAQDQAPAHAIHSRTVAEASGGR